MTPTPAAEENTDPLATPAPPGGSFEAVLRALTEYSVIGCDPSGTINCFNEGAARMLGYHPDEVLGRHTPALLHDPDEVAARAQELGVEPGFGVFIAAAQRGESETREWTYVRKDGSRVPVSLTVTQVTDDEGRPAGFIGIARDITREREAVEEATAAADRFSRIIEATPIPTFISEIASGRITYANPACASLGYDPKDIVGQSVYDLGAWSEGDSRTDMIQRALGEGHASGFATILRAADGSVRDVEVSAAPIEFEGQPALVAVYRDVTTQRQTERERSRVAEELHRAKELADAASGAKSRFLSHMSHEFRTPLNAILGFTQLLEMREIPPEIADDVRHIRRGGEHLLELINQVLDITRIEAGRLPLSIEPVAVAPAVDEAVRLMGPLAADRQLTVTAEADPEIFVAADGHRLRQVLLNLLSNAVKYNRRGGAVIVTARVDDATVRIAVRDSGPGVPADRVDRLFIPFERLEEDGLATEGAGLGLPLSRGLVEAMGGNITVDSTAGVGSVFTVNLPVATAPPSPAANGPIPTPLAPEHTTARVLYVEDNLVNFRLVESVAALRPGIELISAMQGSIGLELARRHVPDLILLDLHLPDMSGEDVLRELSLDPRTSRCPVVVISADATPGRINRLREIGALTYLTKPIDVAKLIELLDTTLAANANTTGPEPA